MPTPRSRESRSAFGCARAHGADVADRWQPLRHLENRDVELGVVRQDADGRTRIEAMRLCLLVPG